MTVQVEFPSGAVKSFNPVPGETVRVLASGYHGMVGVVSAVRQARGNLPTIIAVDLEPNRQVDFMPAELELVSVRDIVYALNAAERYYA